MECFDLISALAADMPHTYFRRNKVNLASIAVKSKPSAKHWKLFAHFLSSINWNTNEFVITLYKSLICLSKFRSILFSRNDETSSFHYVFVFVRNIWHVLLSRILHSFSKLNKSSDGFLSIDGGLYGLMHFTAHVYTYKYLLVQYTHKYWISYCFLFYNENIPII